MPEAKFVLKQPKSKETTLVYLFFYFNNKVLKYSTGQKIKPKFWNAEKQRAKETMQFLQYGEFNSYLNKVQNNINNLYRRFINDDVIPSPLQLRLGLHEALLKTGTKSKNSLPDFIQEIIDTSVKRPNTIKNYKQTLKKLIEFKSMRKMELTFESIDLTFYENFIKYCLEMKYSTNTIGGLIKNIKVFMNEAFDRKLTTNTEYKNRKFKTLDEETENIYLTTKEIEKLYNLDLSKNLRLEKVRDMFIISCYTSLRYSDLIQLTNDNLIDNKTKLKIKTEKTGETVIIPLHRFIRNILIKYDGLPEYDISNQKMNEYLKELGEIAELNDNVFISSTKGGEKLNKGYKKYERITVHTGRRSFATNAFITNIPTISIMKITGHRTEKAFLKYIKISQAENANKLINHRFFK
jgi:integrase